MKQSSAAMTDEQPPRASPQEADHDAVAAREAAAEAKRLEARRRFLLGGAAAVSNLVTAGRAGAQATWSDCATKYNLTFLLPPFLKGSVLSPFDCETAMQQMQQMQQTDQSQPTQ